MDRKIRKVYWAEDCIISSLGFSTAENTEAVMQYRTGLSRWREGTPVCLINKQRLKEEIFSNRLERYTRAASLAILALKKINARLREKRSILIISTTKGDIGYLNSDFEKCYLSVTAKNTADYFNAANEPLVLSNACISGVSAIIAGSRLISRGYYDDAYIAGMDILNDFIISGFKAFKSVSPAVCRPYDAARDGLTLGEGCGAVHLTCSRELSGSKIVVAGGGISSDANHISGPSRTGDGLWFAIKAAMKEARITPEDTGFINMHGTATVYNDEMESRALALGNLTEIPCNSLKPYFGHTLGASGVIESIVSASQLNGEIIYGVKGYDKCGVPYNLNISSAHRNIKTGCCIKTASGFGGCNAALVLCREDFHIKAYKETGKGYEPVRAENIKATGHAEITKHPVMSFGEHIREEYKSLNDHNLKFAKMDNLCKLGYVAACKLLSEKRLPYPPERIAIVLANKSASLDCDIKHQRIIDRNSEEGASPAVFVYTLPNIAAGEIAIKHKLKGETAFFVFPDKSLNFAGSYAIDLIKEDRADAVIYGWCEILGEEYNTELIIFEKQ